MLYIKSLLSLDIQVLIYRGSTNERLSQGAWLTIAITMKLIVSISPEVISQIKNNMKYTVLFERLNHIVLSKSSYKITSFINFSPYADMFAKLKAYIQKLKANLNKQVEKAGQYPLYYEVYGRIQNNIDRKSLKLKKCYKMP